MNDLDVVARLRASVPEPPAARLGAGRDRLTAAIAIQPALMAPRTQPARPARWFGQIQRRRVRRVLAASATAAVAASVAIVAVSGSGRPAGARAGRTAADPVRLTLTARILHSAAVAAAENRTAEPAPGQWFYTRTIGYEYGQVPATGTDEEWQTFDGGYSAYYESGRLIVHQSLASPPQPRGSGLREFNDEAATPLTAYRALASLPSSPKALLAVIAAQVARVGAASIVSPIQLYAPASPNQVQFDYLVELMWNAVDGEPPAAEAAVFRALADLPGVSVQPGITDAAGRPAIGVSDDGGIEQLLFNPQTFAVTGLRIHSTGTNPARPVKGSATAPWPPKGSIIESDAILQVTPVGGPGER